MFGVGEAFTVDVDFYGAGDKLLFSLRGDVPLPDKPNPEVSFFLPAKLANKPTLVTRIDVKAIESGMAIDLFDNMHSRTQNVTIVPTMSFVDSQKPAVVDLTTNQPQTVDRAVIFTWISHNAGLVNLNHGLNVQMIRVQQVHRTNFYQPVLLSLPPEQKSGNWQYPQSNPLLPYLLANAQPPSNLAPAFLGRVNLMQQQSPQP